MLSETGSATVKFVMIRYITRSIPLLCVQPVLVHGDHLKTLNKHRSRILAKLFGNSLNLPPPS